MNLTPAEVRMLVERIREAAGGEKAFGRLTLAEVVTRYREAKWRYLGERKLTA
jgi:hypothetical protein